MSSYVVLPIYLAVDCVGCCSEMTIVEREGQTLWLDCTTCHHVFSLPPGAKPWQPKRIWNIAFEVFQRRCSDKNLEGTWKYGNFLTSSKLFVELTLSMCDAIWWRKIVSPLACTWRTCTGRPSPTRRPSCTLENILFFWWRKKMRGITKIHWIRRTQSCQTGLVEVLYQDPGSSDKNKNKINRSLKEGYSNHSHHYHHRQRYSPPYTPPCLLQIGWSCSGLCGKDPSHLGTVHIGTTSHTPGYWTPLPPNQLHFYESPTCSIEVNSLWFFDQGKQLRPGKAEGRKIKGKAAKRIFAKNNI